MTDTTTSKIAVAHDQLTAKLTELRRRETLVRTQLSPLRYLASPWLYVTIAGLVGYRLGRPSPPAAAAAAAAPHESLTRAIVRAGVVVAAQVLARHALQSLVEEP